MPTVIVGLLLITVNDLDDLGGCSYFPSEHIPQPTVCRQTAGVAGDGSLHATPMRLLTPNKLKKCRNMPADLSHVVHIDMDSIFFPSCARANGPHRKANQQACVSQQSTKTSYQKSGNRTRHREGLQTRSEAKSAKTKSGSET